MDLKAILSHRSHCLICGQEMKFHAPEYPKLTFYINEKGMKISSGHTQRGIRMFFGFDGKYTRTKQNYKVYREPVSIVRQCDDCASQNTNPIEFTNVQRKPLRMKSRPSTITLPTAFFSSLDNMGNTECAYRFQIMGDAEGNYDGALNYEVIRYYNEKAFWHVDTSFVTGTSLLHHAEFSGQLDDILSIKIPAVMNLNNVKNIDQFLAKFKTYTIMS